MTFNKLKDTVLELTPDTGFQMFFFPVEMVDKEGATNGDLLAAIAHNKMVLGRDVARITEQAEERLGWRRSEEHPHVRHRIGTCRYSGGLLSRGIWIAIETNIGGNSRGWFYEKIPTHEPNVESKPPYVAESVNVLQDANKINCKIGGASFTQPVRWNRPVGDDIEVDIIIDFGNTRTCALLLERRVADSTAGGASSFSEICRPLPLKSPFLSDELDFSVEQAICSSRFILKSPEFRNFDHDSASASFNRDSLICKIDVTKSPPPPNPPGFLDRLLSPFRSNEPPAQPEREIVKNIPHMFVKLSPVCMGDDVRDMMNSPTKVGTQYRARVGAGQLMQQSSAKRFFWDDQRLPKGAFWSVMPNFGDPAYEKDDVSVPALSLSGMLLRFQPEDGKCWAVGDAPHKWGELEGIRKSKPDTAPVAPRHPPRCTLTWTILAIIESAQRQINSVAWTKGAGQGRRRKLKAVVGTYPSGWSVDELKRYREKWDEALQIFNITNVSRREDYLTLEMSLDESVASQLPVIYSCIHGFSTHRRGENWIKLNGFSRKGRNGKVEDAIRVMNFDIGGGTTDISIVEFVDRKPGVNVDLEASVKFRDSYSVAGDGLVRAIIEKIVIPRLAGDGDDRDEILARFRKVFSNDEIESQHVQDIPPHKVKEKETRRIRWLSSILIPMAISLLSSRSSEDQSDLPSFCPQELGISVELWNDFCDLFGVTSSFERKDQFEKGLIDKLVVEHFSHVVSGLSNYIAAFNVNMVFVCGKPSEQPALRGLLERILPVPLERIHFASGFRTGKWYPFRRKLTAANLAKGSDANEKISDAKTVTCVGASLHRAIQARLIPGWKMEVKKGAGFTNEWGEVMSSAISRQSFITKISFPGGRDESSPALLSLEEDRRIARKMFDIKSISPEPVYKLVWDDKKNPRPDEVEVVFRRTPSTAESADALEIVSVHSPDGKDIKDSVKLQLFPAYGDGVNWQDDGLIYSDDA